MNEKKQSSDKAVIIGSIVLILLMVLAMKGIFAFLKADAQKNAVPIPSSSASQSIDTPGGSGQQTDEEAPSFCPFCGKELNDSFQWGQFCPSCGKKVEQ